LKSFEVNHEDASIFAVVDWLEMSLELGESPIISKTDLSAFNAVNITTVHSAKGLEFPIVFLVNLSRGRFPTYEKKEIIPIPSDLIKEILPEGNFHEQEERRLFYVGLTRTIDKVFLSASQFYSEGKRERKISPFLIETLDEKTINQIINLKSEEKTQLSIFDFKPVDNKPSDSEGKKEKNNLNQFSFTQLSTFKTCPLQYKYQYILRIPTTPSSAESFGSSIHKTLENFYKNFLSNKNIGLTDLLKIFKQNWIPIGYSSLSHQTKMKKEGEKMLSEYFEKIHSPNLKIISLEKMFRIKVSDNLFLTGKMDRVDLLPNNQIEIIDYKTGRKPDEKELKNSIQLSIYALAATDKGLFNRLLSEIRLSFYFLQDMDKITLQKNKEDIVNVKEEIIGLAKQIQTNDFDPKVGPWCDFCKFRIICEAWQ
jgi:DNA helicase-2/ATP-dependent DNA helicase PcrA